MPLFHLHIRASDQLIPDLEGINLPDLAAAVSEAAAAARAMMREDIVAGELNLDQSIEIHGPNDRYLASVEFGDAIVIRVGERRRLNIVPAT
jgi:hypothetical protein